MPTFCAALLLLVFAATARGQTTSDPASPPLRDGLAIGGVVTPALDGFTDLWLMPALRLSAPLGPRVGFDLDAGRILGGALEFPAGRPDGATHAHVRHFYAGQLRFLTARRQSKGASNYWILGINYVGITRFDEDGNRLSREPVTGTVLGFGSDQLFDNGTRLSAEFGISAPDGFRPFLLVGLQWRPFNRP